MKHSNIWKLHLSRRLFSLILVFVLGLIPTTYLNVSALSQSDAKTWATSQIDKSIGGGECVDLIKAYYAYLGQATPFGNAYEYFTNKLPSGWQTYPKTSDFIPQPGDIGVWDANLPYSNGNGHVAIIISANLTGFSSIDQNWPLGSIVKLVNHQNYNYFLGVIRPYFDNGLPPTSPVPTPTPVPTPQPVTPGSNQVIIYYDSDFRGSFKVLELGEYNNPSAMGFPNDNVSSILVGSSVNAILYQDDDFKGNFTTATGNISNLIGTTVENDRLSSIKVIKKTDSGLIISNPGDSNDIPVNVIIGTNQQEGNFKVDYYNSEFFQGSIAFTQTGKTRVNENWGTGSPDGRINNDHFSAIFTGTVNFEKSYYEFHYEADDKIKVKIDGDCFIDNQGPGAVGDKIYPYEISAGSHIIVVEYAEIAGDAKVLVSWRKITSPTSPATPTGFYSPSKTDTSVNLSWNSVIGSTGYNLYLGSTKVNLYPITSNAYTITGLAGNTTYNFAVKAINSYGESSPNVIYVTTASSQTKYQITLPAHTFSYNIWFIPSVTSKYNYNVVSDSYGNGDSWVLYDEQYKYIDDNYYSEDLKPILQAGKKYALVVFGVDYCSSTLNISFSNAVQISSQPIPPKPTAIYYTSLTDTKVSLWWYAVSGAKGYDVYQGNTKLTVSPISSTSYDVSGLTGNTPYSFTIKAVNSVGESLASPALNVTTNVSQLTQPVLKASSVSYNSLKITWTAISGASGYELYRSYTSTGTYTLLTSTTSTSFTNTGLVFNKVYYFKIRAYSTVNATKVYSAYSAIIYAKSKLSTPVITVARVSSTSLKVSYPAIAGSTGYEIWRSKGTSTTYTLLKTLTTTSFTNTALVQGAKYNYKIRAYRLVGTTKVYSAYSTTKSGTP